MGAALLALAACGGGGGSEPSGTATALSPAAALGEKIFNDLTLSASGRMSCATCHDPSLGHASPFSTPVVLGGPALDQPGGRQSPSIRYLRFNTPFQLASDGTPSGGFFWDGRASSLAEQAKGPFLAANEMANPDAASVIAKLAATPYAEAFKKVFGEGIFSDTSAAFDKVAFALELYQKEDPEFAPFSSKFDAFTQGKASLTAEELNGLALFNRVDKGNCAACHPSTKPDNAPGALFTDFSYDNFGLPRNMAIAANSVPGFFDLGLCGPTRADLADRQDLCGAFKVPSLRNVALRKHYFHNGSFNSLEQVVRFYATRDTNPAEWYPLDSAGNPVPYNDLPPSLRGNINTTEAPYDRRPGQSAALTDAEIRDITAFLMALTDGFNP